MNELNIFDKIDFKGLDKYINDKDVTDINCRNSNEIWVTSNTKGHYRIKKNISKDEIDNIAHQVANKMEKEFNPYNPCLEGDIITDDINLRVSAIHEHLSNDGTSLALRKITRKSILSKKYLVDTDYCSEELIDLLIKATIAKANIIIVGETGCGKTELLKFLALHIPTNQVIVTIEDSLEFNIKDINPKASCTAFRVKEGFDYSSIIAMSLRQNVSRLLLQEARGKEVLDLLNAMSTGHSVMTTIHAKDSTKLGVRIKQMLLESNETLDSINMRLYSLVDLVVHIDKKVTDKGVFRYISTVTEYSYDYDTNQCINRQLYKHNTKLKPLSKYLKERINNV